MKTRLLITLTSVIYILYAPNNALCSSNNPNESMSSSVNYASHDLSVLSQTLDHLSSTLLQEHTDQLKITLLDDSTTCFATLLPASTPEDKCFKQRLLETSETFFKTLSIHNFIPTLAKKMNVTLTIQPQCTNLSSLKTLTVSPVTSTSDFNRLFIIDVDETCCKSADPRYCHQTLLLD